MSAPSVLVIGAGMYVCGRGTEGVGTILPTLVQAQAEGAVGSISVAVTSQQSVRALREKLALINRTLRAAASVTAYPARGTDPDAYRAALAEAKPACAIVAVPDHLHAPIAADVIAAGAHVLVVKPLTTTRAEAAALISAARAKPVYGAVEFHKRWDEANLLLRQAIADGRLGELRHISVEYGQRKSIREAFAPWLRHTSIFQYLGVHYADLIYFLTGATPVRVMAVGEPGGAQPWQCDAVQVLIEWKSGKAGFTSSIVTNWLEPEAASAMSDQRIRVLGTQGRYDSDQKHRGVQLVTDAGIEDVNPYFSQAYRSADGRMRIEGYGPRSIRQFVDDVRALSEGRVTLRQLNEARPTFQEAMVSTAIVEAANASLSQGGAWIAVADDASRCREPDTDVPPDGRRGRMGMRRDRTRHSRHALVKR